MRRGEGRLMAAQLVHYVSAHGPLQTSCGLKLPRKTTALCVGAHQITCPHCAKAWRSDDDDS